jgi:hypothetical protein
MRRPRNPMPLALHALSRNRTTGLYEIGENGIIYSMELELTRKLRDDFRSFRMGTQEGTGKFFTMARWYRDLPKELMRKVTRSGNLPPVQNDFYPDAEHE